MAIKERKQITGTTAQINAYAGYEGQIVWDKEEKTFVGMSGTAGKNYPLASKEYADSKYLPLTGGISSGKMTFSRPDIISRENSSSHIILSGGRAFLDGASLALFGKDIVDARAGGFEIYNFKDANTISVLQGFPNGSLLWAGNKVLCTTGLGVRWVRYSDGLQLCWGGVPIPTHSFNAVVNLPVPYANSDYTVTAVYTDASHVSSVDAAVGTKTSNVFIAAAASPAYDWDCFCEWVTIGFWK